MSSSTPEWVAEELISLDLGDQRRNNRTKLMVQRCADRPGGSIPSMCANDAEAKAAYRLLANPAVEPQAIRDGLQNACLGRLDDLGTIMVAQDTIFLDFTSHPETTGLGPTGSSQPAPRRTAACTAATASACLPSSGATIAASGRPSRASGLSRHRFLSCM